MQIKSTDCKAGLALRYPLVLSEYSHYLETVELLLFLLDDEVLMPDILGDISNVINIRNDINDSLRVQAKGGCRYLYSRQVCLFWKRLLYEYFNTAKAHRSRAGFGKLSWKQYHGSSINS